MKAACAPYPPWVSDCISEYPQNCSYPGVEPSVLEFFLTGVGLKLEIVPCNSVSERTEMLKNGTIDIVCATDFLNDEWKEFATPTQPFAVGGHSFYFHPEMGLPTE